MPRPNLPLVPDESVRSRMVSGKRKERNALKHRKNETLADSAPGLAAPPPHLFLTPFRHAYAGLRTYRSTSRKPSVAICTTRADAAGPSFATSSAYVAAMTALPPSSDSTGTGVLRY